VKTSKEKYSFSHILTAYSSQKQAMGNLALNQHCHWQRFEIYIIIVDFMKKLLEMLPPRARPRRLIANQQQFILVTHKFDRNLKFFFK
jgi:hypothetical protein